MSIKHKQKVLFEGKEYIRTVYNEGGSCAQVALKGERYLVARDPSPETWHVITQNIYYRKRPRIPTGIKKAVFERDNHTCLMCGSIENLVLDHIHPHCEGGSSDIENLQTLCRDCNGRKGSGVAFGAKSRSSYGRPWHPSERLLASRLIQTLLRRGHTIKQIAEKADLPQQSITKMVKRAQGSYESVKKIEELSIALMPDLRVLTAFLENNPRLDKTSWIENKERSRRLFESMLREARENGVVLRQAPLEPR